MSSSSQPVNLLFQALSLDYSVLEALLKKHRNSHGRTLYFRRMKMVLRALEKWQPMSLESDVQDLKGKVQGLQKKKKKKAKDEEWSIYKAKSNETNRSEDLKQSWKEILQTIVEGFPEVISRILHASEALVTEIQRGFFLPFCTVALAALARISCLHKRIGNWAISEIQAIGSQESTNLLEFPPASMQKAVELFLESASDETQRNFESEALLASIGIVSKRSSSSLETNHHEIIQDSENDETAKISRQLELDNENDVGESLVSMSTPSAKATVEKASKPKKNAPSSSEVDQNATILDRLKGGDSTSKGKKKQSQKRKDPSPSVEPSEGDDKKRKKKKKKRKTKTKGKDFFDSLFD
ncbi:unnamed protein product [Cylindrotheca closterium]|uniref:Nucleolus and neural progenitor protein-like N-terminal domain-containing protein n=1 Tax=Cylindrotheca closterium TaxID=2856 RepID=A0AAD2CIM5_9STRA|nr:unnamed protein product [Cylindrotheca closterium]